MTSIGVIGLGHVGRSVVELLTPFCDVVSFDTNDENPYPLAALTACEFAIVCVGTPQNADGSCDVSHVYDAVRAVPTERVLLRSTVPPGTTDALARETGKKICFSPEYVGESVHDEPSWPRGARDVPFLIVGGEPEARHFFIQHFVKILGPEKTYFQTTALEAELVKYMENAFLATKVTFVNEFFELCDAMGADWHTVREAWLLDPRIGRSHSAVFDDARGFG
jgi:nucleotide sugar dehydrogenase